MHECQISDASFYEFCDCICSSSEEYCIVEMLDLSCNMLTTESLAAIIKVVHSCKIKELNISTNKIYSLSSIKGEFVLGVQNASLTLVMDSSIVRICNGENFNDSSKNVLLDKDVWISDCQLSDEAGGGFLNALDTCELITSVYLANVDLLDASYFTTIVNSLKIKGSFCSFCVIDASLSDCKADEMVAEISRCIILASRCSTFDTVGKIELLVLSRSKYRYII